MTNLTKETEERHITDEYGQVMIQTRAFIKDGDVILTELPWQHRTVGPKDDLKGEDAKVVALAKVARKHATKELPAEAEALAKHGLKPKG